MKYLVNVCYDGNYFYGFQKQKTTVGVQNKLEEVLSKLLNTNISIVGASRTDRYVHAYNQYFHFETDKDIDLINFRYKMNKILDNTIYIKNIVKVNEEFNARYDVKEKTYLYKINVGEYNPIEKDYVLQYNKKIDISLIKKAASKIKGEHDFRSFTSDNTKDSYIRNIKNIKITKDKSYVYIRVTASGFLRYMVRNIVGLLLDINDKNISVNDIEKIFESKNRSCLNKPADPHALYLEEIKY